MKQRATIRKSPGGGEASWDVLVDGTPVMTEQTYVVASNVEWSLNNGSCGVTECDEVAAAILAKHPACCTHEYMEALNFGAQKGDVECRKCGQLWPRFDRTTSPVPAKTLDNGPLWPVTPWRVLEDGTTVVDANGEFVASTLGDGVISTPDVYAAAQLIATATCLFDAVESAINALRAAVKGKLSSQEFESIDAALCRARDEAKKLPMFEGEE